MKRKVESGTKNKLHVKTSVFPIIGHIFCWFGPNHVTQIGNITENVSFGSRQLEYVGWAVPLYLGGDWSVSLACIRPTGAQRAYQYIYFRQDGLLKMANVCSILSQVDVCNGNPLQSSPVIFPNIQL